MPLVEDDVYGELVFEGPRPSAIKAFDRHGLVLYCSSYSKTLSPGLRVGLGHPRPLPERGRAAQAGGEPGHGRGPPAGPGRLPRERWVRPPHPAGPAHVPRPDGVDDRRRGAVLPRRRPGSPGRTVVTSCGSSCPDGVDAMDSTTRRPYSGIRIAPGPMFSPSDGYRNFIRLNTGFPWQPSPSGRWRPWANSWPQLEHRRRPLSWCPPW